MNITPNTLSTRIGWLEKQARYARTTGTICLVSTGFLAWGAEAASENHKTLMALAIISGTSDFAAGIRRSISSIHLGQEKAALQGALAVQQLLQPPERPQTA